MAKTQSRTDKLISILSSKWFFRAVVLFFIIQAAWIALSNRYPMAFDEDYHLGVIRLYAAHSSPFWSSQPTHSDMFGAIFRDPAYLYHYLMSWPYRLITSLASSQVIQIVFLRAISVGLFAWALYVYRRLLLAMSASKALTHSLILIFILIPVVPLLAAQINYDNLFIPLTGLLMLWVLEFIAYLKSTKTLNSQLLMEIVCLGLIGSLVKYAYLPFFVAGVACMAIFTGVIYKNKPAKLTSDFLKGFKKIVAWKKWLLIALLLLSTFLCFERYGINYIKYNALVPDCSKVLTIEQCKEFGPWARDYNLAGSKQYDSDHQPLHYFVHDWLYGMWFRMFFAVDGPFNQFQTRGPLTVPANSFITLAVIAVAAVIISAKSLWRKYGYRLSIPLILSLFYTLILWMNGFSALKRTGKPVAINGRYLLPVLLPLMAIGAIALAQLLARHSKLKVATVLAVFVCFLWGGGALTFILRSQDTWYWNNSVVRLVNNGVRNRIGPLVPGYKVPNQYLR